MSKSAHLDISFVVIARDEDAGWMPELLKSLPPGAEICILWNEQGEEEHLKDEGTKELPNGTTVKYDRWTYTGDFSFSAARNVALGSATRDWIMWLDTDDRLLPHQHAIFENLSVYPPGVGGLMCGVTGINPPNRSTDRATPYNISQCRIFRNHLGLEFVGRCHEQIVPAIDMSGLQVVPCSLLVHHVGYEVDDEVMIEKMKRNTRLLCMQYVNGEYYDDLFTLEMLHRDLGNLLSLTKSNGEHHGIS